MAVSLDALGQAVPSGASLSLPLAFAGCVSWTGLRALCLVLGICQGPSQPRKPCPFCHISWWGAAGPVVNGLSWAGFKNFFLNKYSFIPFSEKVQVIT